jgi:aspartate/methionine/tyrosine aminotransferase
MMAEFKERRDLVVDGLNTIDGITCIPPKGSFYAFPNITGTGMNAAELADYLLEEAGVAVLGGTSFGRHGEGYLRISFANSKENLNKALDRIEAALKKKILDKAS